MSTSEIPLYIDLKSPYAFIASHRALALEAEGKAAFDWRPFKLEIGSRAGADPEAFLRRARYIYRDVRRFAGPLGLTVRGPTKIYDSMTALVGLLYAKSAGVHRAYIAAAFTNFFNRELDPGDVEAVTALLANCGADADRFASYLAGPGADQFAASQEEAQELGICGAPMFVVGEELYWGQDRMDMALAAAGIT